MDLQPMYNALFVLNPNELKSENPNFLINPVFYDEYENVITDPDFFDTEDTTGAKYLSPRERITPHFKFPIYNSKGILIQRDFKEARLQKLKDYQGKRVYNVEPMTLSENNNNSTNIEVKGKAIEMKDPRVEEVRAYLRKKYGKTVNSPFLTDTEIRQLNSQQGLPITLIHNKSELEELKKYLDKTYIPFLQKYYNHKEKKSGEILKNLNKMNTANFTKSFFELIQRDLLEYAKKFPNLYLHKANVYSNLEKMKEISENIDRDYELYKETDKALTEDTVSLFHEIKKELNAKEGVRAEKKFKLGMPPGLQGGSQRSRSSGRSRRSRRTLQRQKKHLRKARKTRRLQ